MKVVQCSIDMRRMPGCRADEIQVQRTGDYWFWCEAVKEAKRLELGTAVLGFDGKLAARWHPAWPALIGGEANLKAFLNALEGVLRQWQVIT